MQPGETVQSALVREVEEEIGSVPTEFVLLETAQAPDLESSDSREYHRFLVRNWVGPEPFVRNDEHSELRWFSVEEARRLQLAHPDYLELFARVGSLLSSGVAGDARDRRRM